ncbi:MAG TPA: phosphatidate cytidylyltransferase [Thermodesulfobacteriota bacterium]|nr:phosphatidate cytidylyltransferase [Thermodesulfobacteriota bacterium]
MSNFWQRILTAAVAVPILYAIFRIGGVIYLLFIMALILVGQLEFGKLLRSRNYPEQKVSGLVFSLLLAVAAYMGYFYFMMAFTGAVVLVLVFELKRGREGEKVVRAGITLFGIIYLGWLLGHAVLLRNIGDIKPVSEFALNAQGLRDPGFFFIFFTVACTFLNDTGAYFTGLRLGKRKLAPDISPGKTVEGTIGGIIACILTGIIVNYGFGSPLNSDWTILFSLLIAASAVFGDLVESAIKRGAGIKDTGDIVPGHGGVLDRFDSLIFVFPISYYFVLVYYMSQGALRG